MGAPSSYDPVLGQRLFAETADLENKQLTDRLRSI